MAGALVPAALALACNPQAYLTLDRSQYAPGDSVRVTGSFFKGNADITVSIDRTGQSATIRTAGNGAFSATFALPANAPTGGYGVQAIGFEANGDVTPGLPARASFLVAQAPASSGGGQTAQPPAGAPQPAPQAARPAPTGQPAAPQATRPAPRPATSSPGSTFREPSVIVEPDVQRSVERSGAARRSGATGSDRVTVGGRAVFGGSVAPAPAVASFVPAATAPVAAAPSRATRAGDAPARPSGATSRRAAERTAADDVWAALGTGRTPSVLPVAGDGVAVNAPAAGSQLMLGLLLLGAGALALVGALAAGEVRRRRVRVR